MGRLWNPSGVLPDKSGIIVYYLWNSSAVPGFVNTNEQPRSGYIVVATDHYPMDYHGAVTLLRTKDHNPMDYRGAVTLLQTKDHNPMDYRGAVTQKKNPRRGSLNN